MKKPIVMLSLDNGWAVRMAKRYVKPGTPGAVQGKRGGWYVDVKGRKPGAAEAWRPAKAKPGAPLEDGTSQATSVPPKTKWGSLDDLPDPAVLNDELTGNDLDRDYPIDVAGEQDELKSIDDYDDPTASLTAAVAEAGKGQPDSIGINPPAKTAPSLSREGRAATELAKERQKRYSMSDRDSAVTQGKAVASSIDNATPELRRRLKRNPRLTGKAKRTLKLALQPTESLAFLSPQPQRFV